MKTITVGSDFSGVGAFDFAIQKIAERKQFTVNNLFACDWDEFARKTYLANHKKPQYYPHDVYDRDIPEKPLDIYMTSPPCQGFSMNGGRKSVKDDYRNILFYNSLEFIRQNKPRFFIFENVRGLISHESGHTFNEWLNFLGGKSINNLPVIFPYENSVPYHIYWKVLNTKKVANIPQNRERVFIVGIRDDVDNDFKFPVDRHRTKNLCDVLEADPDDKYLLSEQTIKYLLHGKDKQHSLDIDIAEKQHIKVFSANSKGYEIATDGDSLNFAHLGSKTKRGRVGKKCSQTIDCANTNAVFKDGKIRRLSPRECFRLQGFDDTFKLVVSDNQLFKQAGNSITIDVLELILNRLNL